MSKYRDAECRVCGAHPGIIRDGRLRTHVSHKNRLFLCKGTGRVPRYPDKEGSVRVWDDG